MASFLQHTLHSSCTNGLGGTVKRLAARASLQRPYDEQIMTPRQLFEWASSNISAVSFEYCSTDDYEREQTHLERRFQRARTIPRTRKLHSLCPNFKRHSENQNLFILNHLQ